MIHHFWLRSVLSLAFGAVLFGQKGSLPTAPVNPGTNRLPTTTTQPQQRTGIGQDVTRPVYVSGKVTLDDGTPPPDSVSIQVVCSGSPHSVGYTDNKGRFDIDLNGRQGSTAFADASETGPLGRNGLGNTTQGTLQQQQQGSSAAGNRNFTGCDLQASLPGFRSDRFSLMNQRSLEDPNVGTLILHRLANVEGLTISATSALAPKDARKAFEKGLNEQKKEKWSESQRELEKAVTIYPKYAAAWYNLGFSQQHLENADAARQSYHKALEADSRFVSPLLQLAVLSAKEKKWDDVAQDTDRLIRLNPVDFPDAYFFNAFAHYELHNTDAAEKSARQGLNVDGDHRYPRMNHLLGVILARKHLYPEAAENLRLYLRFAPDSPDVPMVRKQLAEIDRLIGPQTAAQKN